MVSDPSQTYYLLAFHHGVLSPQQEAKQEMQKGGVRRSIFGCHRTRCTSNGDDAADAEGKFVHETPATE
jgi:hypothetical protein